METFTIHDMLINSTDLNRILCSFGIKNISECESEQDILPEPKDINQTVRIALYSLIFLLSVLGNSLIIAVLVRNRRMRTVTNLFLLSLAVSDLTVSLVCIPFTLIPNLMRDFIFGNGTCKLVMYFMGVSVSVSTFNLVAISLERYSAICNPLTSRVWQTKSHAAKVITATWLGSFILMLPYPIFSTLKPFTRLNNSTGHMCRLVWPNDIIQQSWYVSLLLLLFLIPGIVMMTAYGLISIELYRGIKFEMSNRKVGRDRQSSTSSIKPGDSDGCYLQPSKKKSLTMNTGSSMMGRVCGSGSSTSNLMAKKRVIRMLLVIVFLFFLCWTPVFVVNAWQAFDRRSAYRLTGAPISFIHLLSYTSACVNPIIYCFMNKRFRQGMLATFSCCSCFRRGGGGSSGLTRSAGSRLTQGEAGRPREGPKSPEQNGHTSPSGSSTRFTYTGIRASAWSELT
ncbi:cholecystokinin receptor type A [Pundamilia nyererei]|uniref:Gastrin/cholecystokinin type B receptor n=1 Tax=Pundamilia nyererei TaxID=303518 RepID=A0A3B4H3Z1_9CICH|nr:PREDICTED: cholecystokinin receptor type A [Pundamilia nyererei]XP_013769247.1 PREDICTED: cholecystokinin receptor type A [Pundamilia nyererei]XP_013769248.1 PREDICTED: cholecystokinin receptor type A [Pundamilia nyererei]XP_013769249.1 PREDICTED: cholecystokinin receptor type A [Pundamilia nyererei]XP_013769250.1 PREDICTED: cholecystokinin receptor type A [Pundamilia nyererei]